MADLRVGTISAIRRHPVKSMLGEVLESVTLVEGGVVGDRAYALVDDETGKVISVKRPRRWGRLFEMSALTGPEGVVVHLPDGEALPIDDAALAGRLSDVFGRSVSIASVPPAGASFDEVWARDLKAGADPYLGLPSRTEDGEELVDGGQFMAELGNFFNFGAIHLVTTSTLRRLTELAPGSRFDADRFRPNLVIDTDEDGFVETAWPGRTLTIGDVRLAVSFVVPRCVVTTLAQGDLPADPDVLRTATQHSFLDPGFGASYPCVGVYADVVATGQITTGQTVTIS